MLSHGGCYLLFLYCYFGLFCCLYFIEWLLIPLSLWFKTTLTNSTICLFCIIFCIIFSYVFHVYSLFFVLTFLTGGCVSGRHFHPATDSRSNGWRATESHQKSVSHAHCEQVRKMCLLCVIYSGVELSLFFACDRYVRKWISIITVWRCRQYFIQFDLYTIIYFFMYFSQFRCSSQQLHCWRHELWLGRGLGQKLQNLRDLGWVGGGVCWLFMWLACYCCNLIVNWCWMRLIHPRIFSFQHQNRRDRNEPSTT